MTTDICVAIQLGLSLFSQSSWRYGLALSHGLVLDIGLTSLRLSALDKSGQDKYCYIYV